jgi:hypothetical protein
MPSGCGHSNRIESVTQRLIPVLHSHATGRAGPLSLAPCVTCRAVDSSLSSQSNAASPHAQTSTLFTYRDHNHHTRPSMAPSTTAVARNRDLGNSYFDNSTFSDLTIKLSDRVVHVHRVVLCRGSEYFRSLLAGKFKVSWHSHRIESFETEANYQHRKANQSRSSSTTMTPKL